MAWPAPPDGGHAHNPSLSNGARGPGARSRNRSMMLAVEVRRRSMMRADVNQPLCPNLTNQAPPGIQSEIQSHCLHCWSLLHSVAFDSCFSGLGYAGKWVDTIIHIIDSDWRDSQSRTKNAEPEENSDTLVCDQMHCALPNDGGGRPSFRKWSQGARQGICSSHIAPSSATVQSLIRNGCVNLM